MAGWLHGTKIYCQWFNTQMDTSNERFMLGPIIFNIFNNDGGNGTECMLSRFAHHTKLSGPADLVYGYNAIQRNFKDSRSEPMKNSRS